jgi:hypothetical protein
MSYIDGNELIFYNNPNEGIHSGGFSINSIMMQSGMRPGLSPIMTINSDGTQIGGNVSDIFNGLVVPNWAFTQSKVTTGGGTKHKHVIESDDEEDYVEDDLHEKLLDLVKQHDEQIKKPKKNITRKRLLKSKGGTKRRR